MNNGISTTLITSEEWADIPNYPGYQVSSLGHVRSRLRRGPSRAMNDEWRPVKLRIKKGKYPAVALSRDGARSDCDVHRLVLLAFSPPPADNLLVRHLNGDKCDNRLCNLAWGTHADNAADTRAHGRFVTRTHAAASKLNHELAAEIRTKAKSLGAGRGVALAKEYGVSEVTIARLLAGKIWRERPDPTPPPPAPEPAQAELRGGRPANPFPKYERYKGDRARVRYRGREYHLGAYDAPESRAEYRRLCAEWAQAPTLPPEPAGGALVSEVVAAFMLHARAHYRGPDGRPTSEYREHGRSTVHLMELYGGTPAREFGPRALQAVRGAMIDAGWARPVVNKRVGRVRRVFRWAVGQELVPAELVTALGCVGGLQKGRTAAPETEPVAPAPLADVRLAQAHLDRHQRAMSELQLLTGMRPGEVCALRLGEVDRTGAVWAWRPAEHKTAWRGGAKVILFGPRAQAVVREFLAAEAVPDDAFLFSPYRAREERFAAARAARRSKVPPSQRARARKANPKRRPAGRYNTDGYGHAVRAACEAAGVPVFSPNQLRHTFGTAVRAAHGLEAAQVLLGHSRADVTQVYAERNLALALRVAAEIG